MFIIKPQIFLSLQVRVCNVRNDLGARPLIFLILGNSRARTLRRAWTSALPHVAPGLAFVPSTLYNAPIDNFSPSHPSFSPMALFWSKNLIHGPSFSTASAYPRPSAQHSIYKYRPNGGYRSPYTSSGEKSLGISVIPVTHDLRCSPEAIVNPLSVDPSLGCAQCVRRGLFDGHYRLLSGRGRHPRLMEKKKSSHA